MPDHGDGFRARLAGAQRIFVVDHRPYRDAASSSKALMPQLLEHIERSNLAPDVIERAGNAGKTFTPAGS